MLPVLEEDNEYYDSIPTGLSIGGGGENNTNISSYDFEPPLVDYKDNNDDYEEDFLFMDQGGNDNYNLYLATNWDDI